MEKPFSSACERNKSAILEQLSKWLPKYSITRVLEFGSGTGQHAVYFCQHLPQLRWQTADLAKNHLAIKAWIAETAVLNCLPPIVLDANDQSWDCDCYEAIFSANTLHILSWPEVVAAFEKFYQHLSLKGLLIIYGPFNYDGKYTSQSNADFDHWLQKNNSKSAIRDFEKVEQLAGKSGFSLLSDIEMPANNRLLVFQKSIEG